MQDLLSSWKTGASKQAIIDFVARVTKEGGPDFVRPEERIATFDNDGTLWCEKPLAIQGDFLLRGLAAMAERDPSLKVRQPWKAVVEKDFDWIAQATVKHYRGDDSDLKVLVAALLHPNEGVTIEEFEKKATEFLRSARHPAFKRLYIECAYQPMVELLQFLTAAGFTNYIASGGGRDFMRPITQELYGIPPERVIGSSVTLAYRFEANVAQIFHRPGLDLFDDGEQKPVRIWSRVGRRPIFAAGNSNGDIAMLRFCEQPSRPFFCLLLDHDDEKREYAYREGAEQALEIARKEGWSVASIKDDWNTVFVGGASAVGAAA
jgi:phosphoglycolate phosphatase-like HAD superfamily hydrolase